MSRSKYLPVVVPGALVLLLLAAAFYTYYYFPSGETSAAKSQAVGSLLALIGTVILAAITWVYVWTNQRTLDLMREDQEERRRAVFAIWPEVLQSTVPVDGFAFGQRGSETNQPPTSKCVLGVWNQGASTLQIYHLLIDAGKSSHSTLVDLMVPADERRELDITYMVVSALWFSLRKNPEDQPVYDQNVVIEQDVSFYVGFRSKWESGFGIPVTGRMKLWYETGHWHLHVMRHFSEDLELARKSFPDGRARRRGLST